MYRALELKESDSVRILVENRANAGRKEDLASSKHFPADSTHFLGVFEPFLCNSGTVDDKDQEETSLLWYLATIQDQDCVDMVLGKGQIADTGRCGDSSLFHQAARDGNAKVIQLLRSRDPNLAHLNEKDSDGHTPLWVALAACNEACIDTLLRLTGTLTINISEAFPAEDGTMLHQAAWYGSLRATEFLL